MTMPSEKAYDLEQRVNAIISGFGALPGPWTKFNPMLASWGVQSPYTGAWVRWMPGNWVMVSARLGCASGTVADDTVIANMPQFDADGNGLWPAQEVGVCAYCDMTRVETGSNNRAAAIKVGSAGNVYCEGIASSATVVIINGFYPLDPM